MLLYKIIYTEVTHIIIISTGSTTRGGFWSAQEVFPFGSILRPCPPFIYSQLSQVFLLIIRTLFFDNDYLIYYVCFVDLSIAFYFVYLDKLYPVMLLKTIQLATLRTTYNNPTKRHSTFLFISRLTIEIIVLLSYF